MQQIYSVGSNITTTAYLFGGLYEVTLETSAVRKYYSLAGQTVAMQDSAGLKYFLTDHLGSTLAVLDSAGAVSQQQRYLPFGQVRAIQGSTSVTATDFGYTSQRNLADMGLTDYRARFYSASLGRFIQPDSLISNPGNPQAFNRYSYVNNSPINYNDPSGHKPCWATAKYSCKLTGTQVQGLLNGTQREQNFVRNLYWERGIRLPAPSSAFDYHSILGSGGGGGGTSSSCNSSSCFTRLSGISFPLINSYSWTGLAYIADAIYVAQKFRLLENGNYAAYPTRAPGLFNLGGTYYAPNTINTAIVKSFRGLNALGFALGVSVIGNVVDYGFGAHSDTGIMSQEFGVSTVVDTGLAYLIGAGAAAATVVLLGASAPVLAVIGVAALIGIGTMMLVDSAGLPDAIKQETNEFIDNLQGE